jgi:NADPH:quinone reductase-like Zn-dependent oxidoreductase
MMKAYELEKGSTSLESLKLVQREEPKPGPGQVLIRIRAASLNYRDQAVVTGKYFGGVLQRNTIPLSDGAGEVVEVGEGVTRVKTGDRVAGTFFQVWVDGRPPLPGAYGALGSPLDGVLAEYVVLDQDGVVILPDHLSLEEGAALPCAGVTAWNALMFSGRIKPGDTVLTLGTGGVSIFGLQFAKMNGARVIITSSSDEKLERARALGADDVINYNNTPAWNKEVMKITGDNGVDNVIEVGGAGTLAKSFLSLGYGGQVSLIGVLSGPEGDTNPHSIMLKGGKLQGIFVGSRAMFEDMNRAISINGMQPVIDKVFPFEEAAEAYKYQLERKHFGKIVISI